MSVNTVSLTTQQSTTYTHVNSGLPSTVTQTAATIGSTTSYTSGKCYQNQLAIGSGSTQAYNLVSGGLTDLVGDVANINKLYSLTVFANSGAIQMETSQSGGMSLPFISTSGGAFLLNPGQVYQQTMSYSGQYIQLSPTNGNLVARAVSGPSMVTVGFFGI